MSVTINTTLAIATITISRPEMRNALNLQTIEQLRTAFESVSSDPEVHVVILRGAGEEAFCAGADLRELHSCTQQSERLKFFQGIASVIESMLACPKPIIALIHGFALAGGCGLVAASDIACAADDAIFGLPEPKIGLAPLVVLAPLSRVVSKRALSELTLTAENIGAARAYEIGLVNRIFSKAQLEREVQHMAEKICELSPGALSLVKSTLRQVADSSLDQLLNYLPSKITEWSLSNEASEGISAYIEKRKPIWNQNS